MAYKVSLDRRRFQSGAGAGAGAAAGAGPRSKDPGFYGDYQAKAGSQSGQYDPPAADAGASANQPQNAPPPAPVMPVTSGSVIEGETPANPPAVEPLMPMSVQ
jgi:hypothetical protein